MDPKPKRRWFQIHLSTAIVLMFVAGGLVGLNTKKRKWEGESAQAADPYLIAYGWPFAASLSYDPATRLVSVHTIGSKTMAESVSPEDEIYSLHFDSRNVLIDSGVALGILILCALGSEFWIHQRAKKKI